MFKKNRQGLVEPPLVALTSISKQYSSTVVENRVITEAVVFEVQITNGDNVGNLTYPGLSSR